MKKTIALTLLMAGCSAPLPRQAAGPPLPPLPPTPKAQSAGGPTLMFKVQPSNSLRWSYGTTNMAFEVWSTQDLATWSLYGRVTNQLWMSLWTTNQAEFFRCRALDPLTGLTSDWNQ
jgi:hypothetical protein